MNQDNIQKPYRGSSHDIFGRRYIKIPGIAADLLRFYADPVLAEYIDVDHLQPAPTHGISKELKEVIMDVSFLARLRDVEGQSEVLFVLEHKSRPSPMVALQVGTQAFLTLYSTWTEAGYTDAKNFDFPIPIMIVLYNGAADWAEKEIWFQDLFRNIPEHLRSLIPQFRVIVINLRRFQYGNLPGQPLTQAFVESLKRATDGTFAEHLADIFEHVFKANLDPQQTWDAIQSIATYCTWVDELTEDQIKQAILKIFKGKEGIDMSETIPKGFVRDAYLTGTTKGKVEGKIEGILAVLYNRFRTIPKSVNDAVSSMSDLTALDSFLVLAATCTTLDEFADAIK